MIGSLAGAAAIAAFLVPSSISATPPACLGATAFTPVNTPVTLNLGCTDTGANPGVTLVKNPTNGAVSGWPLVYTPNPGHHGFDNFGFTVTNPDTLETSGRIDVSVHTDSRPTCSDGTATTYIDQPVTIKFADFPCTDVDDTQRFIHTFDGPHGSVDSDLADGAATYTPQPGYEGTDEIDFYASDGVLMSSTSKLTITITRKPDPTPTPTPAATAAPAATATPAPPAPPAAVRDTTAPTVKAKAGKSSIAKGVALTLTCDEAGTAKLTVAAGKTRTTKNVKLAKGTKVTVKLSAKARKALKKARRVTAKVTVVVTDAAGNRTTRTLSVKL
jgi:hypothetical protein